MGLMNDFAEYFFTTYYPHRWTSGESICVFDPQNKWRPIDSIERAKEIAEEHRVDSYGENRCITTYGVRYSMAADRND